MITMERILVMYNDINDMYDFPRCYYASCSTLSCIFVVHICWDDINLDAG